jgi:hypothetical protein
MKTFFKYLLIFILPIIILAVSLEVLLRRIPNEYSFKKQFLDRNSDSIRVLILGSSHSFCGINPEYMKSKSFNASLYSQSIDLDLKILKKYENNWHSLRYIVIPIDYYSLYYRLEQGIESWRIKNYNIYFDIKTNNSILDNTEILGNKLNFNLNRLYQYYVCDKSITCSNLGWGVDFNSKNKKNLLATGKESAKRHQAKNNEFFDENVVTLKEIIEFAHARNIKVLLYTSPAYKTYVQNLEYHQLNNTINTVTKIANSYKNVVYYNLLNDKSFNEKDFYDADHLNEIGAKNLTLRIDSIINGNSTFW